MLKFEEHFAFITCTEHACHFIWMSAPLLVRANTKQWLPGGHAGSLGRQTTPAVLLLLAQEPISLTRFTPEASTLEDQWEKCTKSVERLSK